MFTVRDLTVDYPGHRIFDGLDALVGPEPVAIMGPSGSGKSTFLRVLAGQQDYRGSVELDATPVAPSRRHATSDERISVIYQDYRLVEFLSIGENLMLGAECRNINMSRPECAELLALVGLNYLSPDRKPNSLSGGEQQRVAIARSLGMECRALIADEPTGALDFENTGRIAELLVSVCHRQRVQLVVATHDRRVAELMPKILRIQDGNLIEVSGYQ